MVGDTETEQTERLLVRERTANRKKHWVRAVTACNSRCLFCLDADTPRNVMLPTDQVKAELRRGIEELGADKVIISGGEATLHPDFVELVRYASQDLGYDRVQTVTNGTILADRAFYLASRDAGLGEITFSLHGHTAALHDWLTQTPGGFHKLMKGMIRARRDPRGPIVNVDVCINKQNVAVIDKIVELCLSVGVTEFDLLHVIPQANAFENRDLLFYDVREHLPVLHKVFALNRHPGVVIWTNRFPVHFLEGMEELIQDPHKMLDEVNGRRFMVRNYLDVGTPLTCRDADRCRHCFIEPFCTTMDKQIADLNAERVDVWQIGALAASSLGSAQPALDLPLPLPLPLPFGCSWVGLELDDTASLPVIAASLPAGLGVELSLAAADASLGAPPGAAPSAAPEDLAACTRPVRLILRTAAQLDAWLGPLLAGVAALPAQLDGVEIHLSVDTAPWLLAHRDDLVASLQRGQLKLRLHQPSWEQLSAALAHDVRDPASFFAALDLPADLRLPVSGLAACQAPGTDLAQAPRRVGPALFDSNTGRLSIVELARRHVQDEYRCKSVRCTECPVAERCEGVSINMVRDQGLAQCRPLQGAWAQDAADQLRARWPDPPVRVQDGAPLQAAHVSLPGFVQPQDAVPDPLAVAATSLGRVSRPLVKGSTRVKRR